MKPLTSPVGLANLGPLAQLKAGRLPERLLRLGVGLWLYGLAIALMIEGAVGASPWDVFHLGVSQHVPLSFGMVMVVTVKSNTNMMTNALMIETGSVSPVMTVDRHEFRNR